MLLMKSISKKFFNDDIKYNFYTLTMRETSSIIFCDKIMDKVITTNKTMLNV